MLSIPRTAVRLLAPFVVRLEVLGRENFPERGPYILVTNHLAAIDSPIILLVCPHNVTAMAAAKHRRNPVFGPLLALSKPIWVRRGAVDREALQQAMAWLQGGGVLGMAPEGTRSRTTHALQKGRTGAAYLATRADVPIVPVGLTGTEKIKGNFPSRRTDVRVVVGEPFRLPSNGPARGQELEEHTDVIMRHIAALLPEAYRGVYR